MSVAAYLHRSYIILVCGIVGFILSFKNQKARALQAGLVFVAIIVFFRIFFENRFVAELDLFLIPFAAYFLIYLVEDVLKKRLVKVVFAVLLVFVSAGLSSWYYKTTYSALSLYEVWAIDVINERTDAEYDMVTNTIYAPWLYGFSYKETLAPGIFESVWNFDQWVEYNRASDEDKAEMLTDISAKYGKYYLFYGVRDFSPPIHEVDDKINRIFDVRGATIYEVLP